MNDINIKAKEIINKDKRLAPLAKSAKPSKDGPWWMMRNSAGKKDVAMTFMTIAFLFSLFLAVLGSVEAVNFGGKSFNFRAFDMGFATTVLTPLIALYFGRRWISVSHELKTPEIKETSKEGEYTEQPE